MTLKAIGGLRLLRKAGDLHKKNKVEIDRVIEKKDGLVIYFKVQGKRGPYDVRYELTLINNRRYKRKWSCTCEAGSMAQEVCSHRLASEVHLIIKITYGGKL